MKNLEKTRKYFANDRYATELTGIIIDEVREDYAKCSMKVRPEHLNANGFVMGGAIFTLADFAFAAASNTEDRNSVSLSSTIEYFRPAKGRELYAEAVCKKGGRQVGFYEMTVTDEEGKKIAQVNTSGFFSAKSKE
jgi:acyl-CoA thioesterase